MSLRNDTDFFYLSSPNCPEIAQRLEEHLPVRFPWTSVRIAKQLPSTCPTAQQLPDNFPTIARIARDRRADPFAKRKAWSPLFSSASAAWRASLARQHHPLPRRLHRLDARDGAAERSPPLSFAWRRRGARMCARADSKAKTGGKRQTVVAYTEVRDSRSDHIYSFLMIFMTLL